MKAILDVLSTEELIYLDGTRAPYPPAPCVATAVQTSCPFLRIEPSAQRRALRRELSRLLRIPENRLFVGSNTLLLSLMAFFAGSTVKAGENTAIYRCAAVLGMDADAHGASNAIEFYGCDRSAALRGMAGSTLLFDERESWSESADFPSDDKLVILRGFSGRYALKGCDAEYAIASPRRVKALERLSESLCAGSPCAISCVAACAALKDEAYAEKLTAHLQKTRDEAARKLRALGFSASADEAPFIELTHASITPERLKARLVERGIVIYADNKSARIYTGANGEMERLCYSLKSMLPARSTSRSRGVFGR